MLTKSFQSFLKFFCIFPTSFSCVITLTYVGGHTVHLGISLGGFCHIMPIFIRGHTSGGGLSYTRLFHMSLVTRKPVFGVCDQVRLKLACLATETS